MVNRNFPAKSEQKALKKSDFISANVCETLPLKPVKRCVARSGAGRRGWLAYIRLFINQPLPGKSLGPELSLLRLDPSHSEQGFTVQARKSMLYKLLAGYSLLMRK